METVNKDINKLISEKFQDKRFEKKYHRTRAYFRLADELLLLRKKRGLTQKELAEKAGTTQAVVSRLENASVKPSLETVLNFTDALEAVLDIRLTPLEDIRRKSEDLRKNSSFYEKEFIHPSAKPKKNIENSIKYQWTNIILSKPQQNHELFTNLLSLSSYPPMKTASLHHEK